MPWLLGGDIVIVGCSIGSCELWSEKNSKRVCLVSRRGSSPFGTLFDLPAKQSRLAELEKQMGRPGFWDDAERARKVVSELRGLKALIDPVEQLLARADDLRVLYELAVEESDGPTLDEAFAEAEGVASALDRLELMTLLSGPSDAKNCYFNIQAGAGGTESCDWAEMLLRMYLRYFERNDYRVQELSRKDGEEAGVQSVSLLVSGGYAYGYLSCETGVHRLVRISPFDAQSRRHTSFASVDVLPEAEDIEIEIDWATDVREEQFRAGGAGGQHVNKTSSAIRLTHEATGIVVQCQNERSQHQNRATARKMLQSRLHRLEEQKRDAELSKLYSEKGEIAWGNQIRSYVLHPYQMVKDHRTGCETGNTQGVLDGDLQPFIEAELRRRTSARGAKRS